MATATEHHHDHRHDEDHPYDEAHTHPPEQPAGPIEMGAVVLDIGGDIGAAVVAMESAHQGQELEIRPVGEEWKGTHTGIRPSGVPAIPGLFAIFGGLQQGIYELRIKGTAGPTQSMEVLGAEVTRHSWSA